MAEGHARDEEVTVQLLSVLREDESEQPTDLPDRAIRKVQASITSRDLLDLTTVVFLLRFCAPLLDLVAAFLDQDASQTEGRLYDE
jgi:hypothetical protein